MKHIVIIKGSAGHTSANHVFATYMKEKIATRFKVTFYDELTQLPHFVPELSSEHTPKAILEFRTLIQEADGILILTPEYIFSIPSGLKNAFEWCVSTTVFTNKPIGLITAAANGVKGHEELELITRTLDAKFTTETSLLIAGAKGKINKETGEIEENTKQILDQFIRNFITYIDRKGDKELI